MLPSLALSGAANLVAGSVFAIVGSRVVLRRTSLESRLANQAFATYWAGMGAYTAIGGALDILAAAGHSPFGLFLFVRYATLPLICLVVGSSTFYFLFLFTGKQGWLWPILAFYAMTLTALTFYIRDREPFGVVVGGWRTDLAYAAPYETLWFSLLLLALALPPIVGAAFYLRLGRTLEEPTDRRRVTLVASGMILWGLAAILARLASGNDFVEFLSRPVLGLVVAVMIVAAFRPTRADHAGGPEDVRAKERLDALQERVHQLI